MGTNRRLYELDALRGIAALIVVLFHYTTRYEEIYDHKKPNYFLDFEYGHYGVQLFFIISGFVIYMSLSNVEGAKDFFIKRAIRLYPAYIVAVILTFTASSLYVLDRMKVTAFEALLNLTMLQEFMGIKTVDGVYWSLRVEVTFYFLIGFLLVFKLLPKIEWMAILWLVVSAGIKITNQIYTHPLLDTIEGFGITNFCHLFVAGIMFYHLWRENKLKYHMLIVLSFIYEVYFMETTSILFTAAFYILFYLLIYNKLSFINKKPLIFLGGISYSLYLIHQNLGYIIIDLLEKYGFVSEFYILIPLTISLILATLITRGLEQPVQKILVNAYKKKSLETKSLSTLEKSKG